MHFLVGVLYVQVVSSLQSPCSGVRGPLRSTERRGQWLSGQTSATLCGIIRRPCMAGFAKARWRVMLFYVTLRGAPGRTANPAWAATDESSRMRVGH